MKTSRNVAAKVAAKLLLPLLGLTALAPVAAQAEPAQRLIVKYKSTLPLMSRLRGGDRIVLQNPAARAGVTATRVRMTINGADVVNLFGRHLEASELQSLIAQIGASPDVEYVEEDRLMQALFTPDDPRYNEQWSYYESTAGLRLPEAWDNATGAGVTVAVVDTGYRPHPDLAANIVGGYDFISDATVGNDGNGRDADATDPGDGVSAGECGFLSPARSSTWHGTHVSGTIAAVTHNSTGVAGVAFAAKVLPVRALGKCGGYMSDIAEAVAWASGAHVDGVPDNAHRARVINLSLGGSGSCDRTMQTAINTARGNGAAVVVAAGNSSTVANFSTPAGCAGVITVAAVNRSGARASYSNYGSVVDVAAPGGQMSAAGDPNGILSTLNGGANAPGADTYGFYQGTSMATPHVAGVAALLLSKNPALTPDRVESVLKNTARAFPANCYQCGAGIVNAAAAVAAANQAGVASCPAGYRQYDGSIAQGASVYLPDANGYAAAAGAHSVQLFSDVGTNFNLSLEQNYRSPYSNFWMYVTGAFSGTNNKSLSYNGAAGTYRARIDAYYSGGAYTLCVKSP